MGKELILYVYAVYSPESQLYLALDMYYPPTGKERENPELWGYPVGEIEKSPTYLATEIGKKVVSKGDIKQVRMFSQIGPYDTAPNKDLRTRPLSAEISDKLFSKICVSLDGLLTDVVVTQG